MTSVVFNALTNKRVKRSIASARSRPIDKLRYHDRNYPGFTVVWSVNVVSQCCYYWLMVLLCLGHWFIAVVIILDSSRFHHVLVINLSCCHHSIIIDSSWLHHVIIKDSIWFHHVIIRLTKASPRHHHRIIGFSCYHHSHH